MNRTIPLFTLPVFALGVFLAACSGRPEAQIARTEQAMQQAKDEHAQEFAPDDWGPADEAHSQAQTLLEQKKWVQAGPLLLKAQTGFQKARDVAKRKRADFIRDVQSTQGTALDRCKTIREFYKVNLSRIPSPRRKGLEDACNAFDEKLAKVTSQLDQGQFQDAKTLAGTTLTEVLQTQLELEKLTGRKVR